MRRKGIPKRVVLPDPKYHSRVVSEFINMVMQRGKKSLAEDIVYGALAIASERANKKDPLEIFQKAVENVKPLLEVKPKRVGGATYQVPVEVKQERGVGLALRWIRNYAHSRKGKSMREKLAGELLDAYKGEGAAVKKKQDTHKMAESNRAFSHFRW
jgi:small subunit ribosomal protein S7